MKVRLNHPLLRPMPDDAYDRLTRGELIVLLKGEHALRVQLEGYVNELEEKVFEREGMFFRVKSKLFGKSSERSKRGGRGNGERGGSGTGGGAKKKQLSERYPDAEIIEKHITCEEPPACRCCGECMQDSGMTETAEYLTVIPRRYIIVRQHRHKYRCKKCHGDVFTTPAIPRIIPGSSLSDELIIDATLSKFLDLIPMERYCQMAARQGFKGLPPQTLISAVITFATFLWALYLKLRAEALASPILYADETPHRMLEGDKRENWYLWEFLSDKACFYECHDTRSGDVASAVLAESACESLISDVYSGYKKATREANEQRIERGLPPIKTGYCNAHARREFKGFEAEAAEAAYMVARYREIYRLNTQAKDQPREVVIAARAKMRPIYQDMKRYAEVAIGGFSSKSSIAKGFSYFLKNYEGLTLFLSDPRIAIDNNGAERMLRSPVIGRKTWYGTHSKDGAMAMVVHFSIVNSCKLNDINPRHFYKDMVARIHAKQPILTPSEYAAVHSATAPPPLH